MGLDIMADSGHYESELPPDDEGNPRMPSDVMYFRSLKIQSMRRTTYYVPESFFFDYFTEL
jgi:hypothetical protein